MQQATQMFSLDGEVAVVTGGAGVLPSAMAAVLLRAGAKVAIWGRGTNHPISDAAESLREQTGAAPDAIGAITVDTADESAVEDAFTGTEQTLGRPTILVNGVGGNSGKGPFTEIDIATFERVLSLNLTAGLVVPTKVFARRWIESQQEATIINVASMASYTPLSGVWAYDAAKAAVQSLTQGSAVELAQHGIRVNAIAPGFFLGYQNRALLVADDATGKLTGRGRAIIDHTPMGRFGETADIEGATVFLASRAASGFVTGITVPVDGGFLVKSI